MERSPNLNAADFHSEITFIMAIFNSQRDITEHGVGERCAVSQYCTVFLPADIKRHIHKLKSIDNKIINNEEAMCFDYYLCF